MRTTADCPAARAALRLADADQAKRLAERYHHAGNYSAAAYWRNVEAANRAAADRLRPHHAGATGERPCRAA